MKIQRTINAIIGATKDRRNITRDSKRKLEGIELRCFKTMENISGPSVHNPIKVVKSWYKAYKEYVKRLKLIEDLNKPFKKPSIIKQIYHKLTKK